MEPQSSSDADRLNLVGDLDISRRLFFEERLDQLADFSSATIDFTEVGYVDSSAVTCLLRFRKRVLTRHGRCDVKLVGLNPQLRRIFEMCGILDLFRSEQPEQVDPTDRLPKSRRNFGRL